MTPWYPDHLEIGEHAPRLGESSTALLSADGVYRYALTRRWAAGPWCAFVMLNPSTADAFDDDPTIRRCVGYAQRWGFAGLLVLNLFAVRSPDPKVMRSHPEPVGPANDVVILSALLDPRASDGYGVGRVVMAWGAHGGHQGRDLAVTRLLRGRGLTPQCLGRTTAGQPRHPLYLPATAEPVEFAEVSP